MSSMSPPAASSSLPLPSSLRAPPVIPSLGDCFPCGSINLGKYILYSSARRQRARWRTSLALSFGGHGTLPFADNSVNTVNADAREPKTQTQRFSMHDGTQRMDRWRLFRQRNPCGINFMSAIFTLPKIQSSQRHFAIASAFRIPNPLPLGRTWMVDKHMYPQSPLVPLGQ